MPSRNALVTALLLSSMDVVAGFSVVLSSGLLLANRLGDSLFWILLLGTILGVAAVRAAVPLSLAGRPLQVALVGIGVFLATVSALFTALSLADGFFTAVFMGLAYYRGAISAAEIPEHAEVMWAYGRGLILFTGGVVWMIARQLIYLPGYWHILAILGVAYILLAMVALVTSRIDQEQTPGSGAAVALAVAFQLLILLLLGAGGVLLFSHNLGALLFNLGRPLWNVIGFIGLHVWLVIISPLIWALQFLQAHYHHPSVHQSPNPNFGQHCVEPGEPNPHHYPECPPNHRLHAPPPNAVVTTILGLVFGTLVVTTVGLLIWRVIPRALPRRAPPPFKERRRFLPPTEIIALFLAWLRTLFGRAGQTATGVVESARRRITGPTYPEDPVRQVYARLLHRAQSAGLPRPQAVTPSEYQKRLAARWPTGSSAFAAITDAYVLRRYGEIAFAPEQVSALRAQWNEVRAIIHREETPPVPIVPTPAAPASRKGWREQVSRRLDSDNLLVKLLVDTVAAGLGLTIWIGLVIFGLILLILIVTHGH